MFGFGEVGDGMLFGSCNVSKRGEIYLKSQGIIWYIGTCFNVSLSPTRSLGSRKPPLGKCLRAPHALSMPPLLPTHCLGVRDFPC